MEEEEREIVEEDPAWKHLVETLRRKGLGLVVEGGEEEEEVGVAEDPAQRKAEELAERYGRCRAAYILWKAYEEGAREL